MMAVRKHFDKALYAANDDRAKKAFREIFEKAFPDLELVDHEKKTHVDFAVKSEGVHLFNVEVEVKNVWPAGKEFPWPTIQYPARKEKYCLLDKPTVFVMFDENLEQFLTVTSWGMLASKKAMVRNKFVPYGEEFFQVEKDNVVFNELVHFENFINGG